MVLSFAFCNVSVLPVHATASHKAEQTTQLLFGERAEVLEITDKDWARIRVAYDDYEGWCKVSQLTFLSRKEYRKAPGNLAATHTDKLLYANSAMPIPLGSELTYLKKAALNGDAPVKFKGKKLVAKKLAFTPDAIEEAAMQYLHAPYQWGGRSLAGIDCSGLTQMAYKLCGHKILRDASQQATEGKTLDFLQNAQCGDLAFFDNADGKIVHVGILLSNESIIHATDTAGRVVIDRIDPGGIISLSQKKRTHQLRLVKRFL